MRSAIQRIASEVKRMEEERERLAQTLLSRPSSIFPEALEMGLVHAVAPAPLDFRVCAVDGGLLAQEFHGFDLVLSRAAGVLFEYRGARLEKHAYHPSPFPPHEIDALSSLDSHDFNLHKSLFRLKKELSCAIECLEKWKPDLLLLDGSLVPQISDKPPADSELHPLYSDVVGLFKRLYSTAAGNSVCLAGIIKDSRGKRFLEIIGRALPSSSPVISRSNDTSFLHFLLRHGERTFCFPYASSSREHAVLRDFGEWGVRINVFYVKPAEGDRPLRVEFLGALHEAFQLAPRVLALSAINAKYAYPAVLIEADLRAAMDPVELERAYREICLQTGLRPSTLKLRRDTRPFR